MLVRSPGDGLPPRCTYGAAADVVEKQARPWTRRPRRFGADALLFPHWFPFLKVLSGDSLDDYGTVLWGGAALRSKVNVLACGHRVFLLRSDLIDVCCCFSDICILQVRSAMRTSVLPHPLLLYCIVRLSPVTPSLRFCASFLPVALRALTYLVQVISELILSPK